MNKTISEVVVTKWYEYCKGNLECHSANRLFVERTIKDPLRINLPKNQKRLSRWDVDPYLLAHEFLYLLCNSEDRL